MISRAARRILLVAGIIVAASVSAFAQAPSDTPPDHVLMRLRQIPPPQNDTAELSADQRRVIADHVHACWSKVTGKTKTDQQAVLLVVKTDVAGVVQKVEVAFYDVPRVNSDPRLHA